MSLFPFSNEEVEVQLAIENLQEAHSQKVTGHLSDLEGGAFPVMTQHFSVNIAMGLDIYCFRSGVDQNSL